jgi:tRNA 5-methylaminomethyl-2-thiouridine biosynthesis bifunctional protein
VKTAPIAPARLERDADGTPYSSEYGDVYHPHQGALEQARRVFLAGNALPMRWRGRERFQILEAGFGLGNNFLATWSAWRADPERCRQLHFISIEARPLRSADLAELDRDAELGELAAQLVAAWPPLVSGLHRLAFEHGRVELLLAFGDIASWLPQIEASVDAFYLDGFAPAKNPRMWEPRLFKAMARIAAADATAATWSAARVVREGLRGAGFATDVAPGIGAKRDITLARFAPAFAPRTSPRRRAAAPVDRDEPVVIVGAGLAGCATAWALAEQGRESLLVERRAAIAGEGSGNAAGLFHGVVHRDDARHARFHRAAALEARQQVAIAIAEHGVPGSVDGLLRLDPEASGLAGMQATLAHLGWPADYVRAVSADEASALAGLAIDAPGWHFPGGGWVDPRGLARSFVERAGRHLALRLDCEVLSMRRSDGRWALLDAAGRTLATATTLVFADAGGAGELLGGVAWPIELRRGQLSAIAAGRWPSPPRLPIAGSGYVLPVVAGRIWFGATSQAGDRDATVRADDHRDNLERLSRLLACAPGLSVDDLEGRTAFRWSSIDRLPLVGAVPRSALGTALRDACGGGDRTAARPEQPRFAPRAPGLYMCAALGSRGIAASALGARVLASAISGAPAPIEADLLDAIDPARFASRAFRRSGAARDRTAQAPEGPIAGGSTGV